MLSLAALYGFIVYVLGIRETLFECTTSAFSQGDDLLFNPRDSSAEFLSQQHALATLALGSEHSDVGQEQDLDIYSQAAANTNMLGSLRCWAVARKYKRTLTLAILFLSLYL